MARAAAAAAVAAAEALEAELREVTRARRDMMERRRARLEGVLDDGGDDDDGDDDDGGARQNVDGAAREGVTAEPSGDERPTLFFCIDTTLLLLGLLTIFTPGGV